MNINKIDNETYRRTIKKKVFTIKKVTKYVWQAFDEQGVKISTARAQSIKKVNEALDKIFIDKDLTVSPMQEKETVEQFVARGGKIEQVPAGRVKELPITGPSSALKPKQKKSKKKKAKKSDAPKAPTRERIRSQENVITLQEIIDKLGISGMKARKILRGSGIEKPGKQWVWDRGSKDHKKVQTYFEEYLGIESTVSKAKKKSGKKK